jgi:hypothetical protein
LYLQVDIRDFATIYFMILGFRYSTSHAPGYLDFPLLRPACYEKALIGPLKRQNETTIPRGSGRAPLTRVQLRTNDDWLRLLVLEEELATLFPPLERFSMETCPELESWLYCLPLSTPNRSNGIAGTKQNKKKMRANLVEMNGSEQLRGICEEAMEEWNLGYVPHGSLDLYAKDIVFQVWLQACAQSHDIEEHGSGGDYREDEDVLRRPWYLWGTKKGTDSLTSTTVDQAKHDAKPAAKPAASATDKVGRGKPTSPEVDQERATRQGFKPGQGKDLRWMEASDDDSDESDNDDDSKILEGQGTGVSGSTEGGDGKGSRPKVPSGMEGSTAAKGKGPLDSTPVAQPLDQNPEEGKPAQLNSCLFVSILGALYGKEHEGYHALDMRVAFAVLVLRLRYVNVNEFRGNPSLKWIDTLFNVALVHADRWCDEGSDDSDDEDNDCLGNKYFIGNPPDKPERTEQTEATGTGIPGTPHKTEEDRLYNEAVWRWYLWGVARRLLDCTQMSDNTSLQQFCRAVKKGGFQTEYPIALCVVSLIRAACPSTVQRFIDLQNAAGAGSKAAREGGLIDPPHDAESVTGGPWSVISPFPLADWLNEKKENPLFIVAHVGSDHYVLVMNRREMGVKVVDIVESKSNDDGGDMLGEETLLSARAVGTGKKVLALNVEAQTPTKRKVPYSKKRKGLPLSHKRKKIMISRQRISRRYRKPQDHLQNREVPPCHFLMQKRLI